MNLLKIVLELARRPKYAVWSWVRRGPVAQLSSRTIVLFYDREEDRPRITQSLKDEILDKLDAAERDKNADINYVRFITAFVSKCKNTPAVPVRRAGEMLEMTPANIYVLLDNGKLELCIRKGQKWVTLRSIARYLVREYRETEDFCMPKEVLDELRRN